MAYWATILKKENTYIGRCGLVPHFDPDNEPIPGEAALGYYIAPKYWGQGFAMEAGKAFIHFGFNELALRLIVATIEKGNDASEHIIKKLGFSLTYTEEGKRTFYHFTLQNPTQH
jgi:ribosomal-protein-alanine N-acetyltransferase